MTDRIHFNYKPVPIRLQNARIRLIYASYYVSKGLKINIIMYMKYQ